MNIKISVANYDAQRKNQTAHYKSFGFPFGDPGGTRTHDPLIKSQLLYQLSYGVNVCSIATAKVLLFSEPPTIFAIFFKTITFPNIFSSKILSIPVFCPVSKYKRLRIKLTL